MGDIFDGIGDLIGGIADFIGDAVGSVVDFVTSAFDGNFMSILSIGMSLMGLPGPLSMLWDGISAAAGTVGQGIATFLSDVGLTTATEVVAGGTSFIDSALFEAADAGGGFWDSVADFAGSIGDVALDPSMAIGPAGEAAVTGGFTGIGDLGQFESPSAFFGQDSAFGDLTGNLYDQSKLQPGSLFGAPDGIADAWMANSDAVYNVMPTAEGTMYGVNPNAFMGAQDAQLGGGAAGIFGDAASSGYLSPDMAISPNGGYTGAGGTAMQSVGSGAGGTSPAGAAAPAAPPPAAGVNYTQTGSKGLFSNPTVDNAFVQAISGGLDNLWQEDMLDKKQQYMLDQIDARYAAQREADLNRRKDSVVYGVPGTQEAYTGGGIPANVANQLASVNNQAPIPTLRNMPRYQSIFEGIPANSNYQNMIKRTV